MFCKILSKESIAGHEIQWFRYHILFKVLDSSFHFHAFKQIIGVKIRYMHVIQ